MLETFPLQELQFPAHNLPRIVIENAGKISTCEVDETMEKKGCQNIKQRKRWRLEKCEKGAGEEEEREGKEK